MKHNHKLIIVILLVMLLAIIAFVFTIVSNKQDVVSAKKAEEIATIQQQIFVPLANLSSDSNQFTIVEVNGWSITNTEVNMRQDLYSFFRPAVDYDEIFNTLIEEKVKLSQAQSLCVLPSIADVAKEVETIRTLIMSEPETSNYVQNLAGKLKISVDDYWKICGYYDNYRSIAFKNYYNQIISDQEWDETLPYWEKTRNKYFNNKLLKAKKQATIKWIDNKNDYTIIKDKLFTGLE